MSSYSKKFSTPDDASKFLFLTWETGYNQLKIYFNGRMITSVNNTSELTNGFYFEDEEIGTIKLKFTNSKPVMLEVSVDGSKYYPEVSKLDNAGISSASSVLWIITGFALAGSFLIQLQHGFNLNNPTLFIQLIMDLIIIPIYAISAYFTGKGKGWAYFLGVTTFLLITILSVVGYQIIGWNFIAIFTMLIRVVFLVFLFSFAKRAIIAIRAPREMEDNLLDA